MNNLETLHEALHNLKREKEALLIEVTHANTLLSALGSLLLIDTTEDPFGPVFASLRKVFDFERAAAFTENEPGCLTCVAASIPSLAGVDWKAERFLSRILGGRVTATFSNKDIEECRTAPERLLPPDRSAIFIPLRMAGKRGLLSLVKSANAPGFDRRDIELAKKFSLLASHAMAACNSRKMIEETQIRAAAAEDASRAKSQFIANMSHELRTPLNAIIGFSEFVAMEMLGPIGVAKYREYVRDIHASGNHLLMLVNDILFFSKMEAGQHKTEPVALSLAEEVECAHRMLGVVAAQRKITLDAMPLDENLLVCADRLALRQILLNLLGNAVKFSHDGGTVMISGEPYGASYRLRIMDRGCGIPHAVLKRLGMPFVQAEDVMSRKHHGTGLGLAICFGLARSIGATLSIESVEDVGTTAILDLSLAEAARQTSAA